MSTHSLFTPLLVALCFLIISASVNAQPKYAFVQMGQLKLSDNQSSIEHEGNEYIGEFDDLPFFSGGIQQVIGGDTFRYGYEGGAILSWKNDSIDYRAQCSGGCQAAISIDNELFVFTTFLGAMADINFNDYARLYVSSGPMITFSSVNQVGDNPEVEPHNSVSVNGVERSLNVGVGWYGALGLIISPTKATEFGLVIRQQNVNLNIDSRFANPEYDGTQMLFSLGYKL